jgi:hypothetical protein
MPGLLAHRVRLPLVLGHVGVHEADDVGADRGLEDVREGSRLGHGVAVGRLHSDEGSSRHRCRCCCCCCRRRRRREEEAAAKKKKKKKKKTKTETTKKTKKKKKKSKTLLRFSALASSCLRADVASSWPSLPGGLTAPV